MSGIYKKVDLSNLPKNEKTGNIDWINSVGCEIPFQYGEIQDSVKIVDYISDKKSPIIVINYHGKEKKMDSGAIQKCSFGKLLGAISSDFYYSINQIIKTKHQELKIVERFYKKEGGRNRKYYEVECSKCHCNSTVREMNLKQGKGCPVCASKIIVKGVNDIPTTAKWMIPYFPGGYDEASQYSIKSSKNIQFICPCCGKHMLQAIPIYQLYRNHSCGCQCEKIMSFPERVIYNLLDMNGIKFMHCATKNNYLPWAQKYRYDFYLIDYNIIVEAHGLQHYDHSGFENFSGKTLQEQKEIDKAKRELAIKMGISKYYEINCKKSNIDYILKSCQESGLLKTLDINIDSLNKEDLSENILLKHIITTKKALMDNDNITLDELSEQLNTSSFMTKKIVNLVADTLGLRASGNTKKSRKRGKNVSSNPIYVYKDGQYLATFQSFYDVYTNSETRLGIKIKTHDPKKYIDTGRRYLGHYTFSRTFNDMGVEPC